MTVEILFRVYHIGANTCFSVTGPTQMFSFLVRTSTLITILESRSSRARQESKVGGVLILIRSTKDVSFKTYLPPLVVHLHLGVVTPPYGSGKSANLELSSSEFQRAWDRKVSLCQNVVYSEQDFYSQKSKI